MAKKQSIYATRNLKDILRLLKPLVASAGSYELEQQLEQATATHTAMLRYMVEGVDDPNAKNIYRNLQQQCYVMADRTNRRLRLQRQAIDKYTLAAKNQRPDTSLHHLLLALETQDAAITDALRNPDERPKKQDYLLNDLRTQHEATLQSLFENVWTSDAWHKSDYETASAILASDYILTDDKCLLISAVTLALTEMYDERKLMFLFDAYLLPDTSINQRAIVGLLLILHQHQERAACSPQVRTRLSLYAEDPHFSKDFYRVSLQLHYSRLTDSIDKRMRDDIIPTLLRSTRFKKTEYGIAEMDDYLTQNGENPEWHHNTQADRKAEEKMYEMAELQMEGADIYMSTFTHMKGYPFFQPVAHWFYPFNELTPEVAQKIRELNGNEATRPLVTMLRVAPFCNSDRYSFLFMLDSLGDQGKELLAQQIGQSMSVDEMNETFEEIGKQRRKATEICRSYIADLYRFFRIYPYHLQFTDPFNTIVPQFPSQDRSGQAAELGDETAAALFAPLLTYHEELLALAEFLMRKELYDDAIQLYFLIKPQEREDDAHIWQKLGFCYQKKGEHIQAFSYYNLAYELQPNSLWTLKHMAQEAFARGHYDKAETYYDLLLDTDPNNTKYLAKKIGCMMHTRRFDQAITLLHKVRYIDPDTVEHTNNLAWCYLMTAQAERAIQLYQSVLDDNPQSPAALFNLASAYTLAHDLSQACQLYRQAYQATQKEEKEPFRQKYFETALALRPLGGLDTIQANTLFDAIRM